MSEDAFRNLAGYIDVIYHCAADVRHYAADEAEFLERNVGGTRTVIELARYSNAVLHHMSTASIGGEYLKRAAGYDSSLFRSRIFILDRTGKTISISKASFWRRLKYTGQWKKGFRQEFTDLAES